MDLQSTRSVAKLSIVRLTVAKRAMFYRAVKYFTVLAVFVDLRVSACGRTADDNDDDDDEDDDDSRSRSKPSGFRQPRSQRGVPASNSSERFSSLRLPADPCR